MTALSSCFSRKCSALTAITVFGEMDNESAGVPGVLAALSLAYVSNLFGSIAHYSSGQGAVYYGANFLSLKEVFSVGGIMAVVNLTIWGVAGSVWWKVCGFY